MNDIVNGGMAGAQFSLGLSHLTVTTDTPAGEVMVEVAMVIWASGRNVYEVTGQTPTGTAPTIDRVIARYLDLGLERASAQGRLVPTSMAAAERGWRISLNTTAEQLTILEPDRSQAITGSYAGQSTPGMQLRDWLQALHRMQAAYLYTGDIRFTPDTTDLETPRAAGTLLAGVATLEYEVTHTDHP